MNAHSLEVKTPDGVPQEVCAPPGGLDQRYIPARSGHLQDQAGDSGPTSDVQQRRRWFRYDCKEHQRLQDEVAETLRATAIGRQATHALPPVEFVEIRGDLGGEGGRDREG